MMALLKNLEPTGVASISVNGIAVHSILGLPYREKLFLLGSNTLAVLRDKYVEVELIMIDEISMIIPILAFASRSILVVGDFYQLSPVRTM